MSRNIKLDEAIKKSGLKKKYISQKLGINPAYYATFMENPEKMSYCQAITLCELLGLNINDVDFSR